MKRPSEHTTGVRTTGWAAFALLCLVAQEERGVWFWLLAAGCGVWLALGLYILAGEMKAYSAKLKSIHR